MFFYINVATDTFGKKQNVRLEFITIPSVFELKDTAERHYDILARSCRPLGYPDIPYRIQTFQIYDDILLRWVDLYSSNQLVSGCQVYAFQHDSIWNPDYQGSIPFAKDSVSSSNAGLPRKGSLAASIGVSATQSEKIRAVFVELDTSRSGIILHHDLRSALLKCNIEYSSFTIGSLFNRMNLNLNGTMSYDDWFRFGIDYPNIIDALFFISRDNLTNRLYVPSITDNLSSQRTRELELTKLHQEHKRSIEEYQLQRDYENAKIEANSISRQADLAKSKEQLAFDRLQYLTSSPRYGYL